MLPSADRAPGVRKIAVLRSNALGDLIFFLPALEGLRAAYPDAEIVLLGKELHRDFFCGRFGRSRRDCPSLSRRERRLGARVTAGYRRRARRRFRRCRMLR
jgi:hypothetical protein